MHSELEQGLKLESNMPTLQTGHIPGPLAIYFVSSGWRNRNRHHQCPILPWHQWQTTRTVHLDHLHSACRCSLVTGVPPACMQGWMPWELPPPMLTPEWVGKYPHFLPSVLVIVSKQVFRVITCPLTPLLLDPCLSLSLSLLPPPHNRQRAWGKINIEQTPGLDKGQTRGGFQAKDSSCKIVLEVGKGLACPRLRNEALVAATRGWVVGEALREVGMGQIPKRLDLILRKMESQQRFLSRGATKSDLCFWSPTTDLSTNQGIGPCGQETASVPNRSTPELPVRGGGAWWCPVPPGLMTNPLPCAFHFHHGHLSFFQSESVDRGGPGWVKAPHCFLNWHLGPYSILKPLSSQQTGTKSKVELIPLGRKYEPWLKRQPPLPTHTHTFPHTK